MAGKEQLNENLLMIAVAAVWAFIVICLALIAKALLS
jgi:hypothetical protein